MNERLQVAFHPSLPEHAQQLLAVLDVDVRFDDEAPLRCECEGCQAFRRDEQRYRTMRKLRRKIRAGICPLHDVAQPCMICAELEIEP